MANRWITGPLHAIKRGITSLFVCLVVMLPLILLGVQVKGMFGPSDSRKDSALAAMQVRSIDRDTTGVKPFDEPLISVTFDDGWETIYTEAAPLLQKYGIPSTQYVLSDVESNVQYMTFAQMKALGKAGHELACHGSDHSDLTTLTAGVLTPQLSGCKAIVETKTGFKIREFASPYGSANPSTVAAIAQDYRSHRNTNGDIMNSDVGDQDVNVKQYFNKYNIMAVTIRRDTTNAQLQAAIDFTIKNNGWLVLNYHQVDDGQSQYGLDAKTLESQLRQISAAKARIVTMGQTLDALEKQGQ